MPKRPALPLIEETVPAAKEEDKPWSVAVIFDRRTLQPVGEEHRNSPIGRAVESWLSEQCKRPADGYVAACAVGMADWHQLDHPRQVLNWLTAIGNRFELLVETALRELSDSSETAEPVFDVDGSKLWLRVFYDLNLAQIEHRLHNYHTLMEKVARKPVPQVEPHPKRPPSPEGTRAEYLDALLATVPKGATYEEKADKLAGLNHEVRQRFAAELAPALNTRIQTMPHDTYEEKKELARWVNDQLEPLGLAVQCPNTGLPAKLRGHAGNWPGVGRFAFEVYSDGKRKTPSVSDKLPELTLIDATPPNEAEVDWQQAVGPRASRSERRR